VVNPPNRNRRIFPGIRLDEVEDDYFPANTIEVNGESFHKAELLEIHRFMGNKPDAFAAVDAFLLAEPDNPFDSNAVAVYIHEKRVGYLPKELAVFCTEYIQQDDGQGYWVQAAIKYVSSLNQFRVRLLAEYPFVRDLNVLPFAPKEYLPSETVSTYFMMTEERFDVERITWRSEIMGEGKTLFFAGPFPALIEDSGPWMDWNEAKEEPNDGGWAVAVRFLGKRWTTFNDSEAPDLVRFVNASGGLARTQVHFIWDPSVNSSPLFTFSEPEGIQPERIHPDAVYDDLLLVQKSTDWDEPSQNWEPF
jgi:hypothetical protein